VESSLGFGREVIERNRFDELEIVSRSGGKALRIADG
jgi:hypothetical protein